MTSSPPPRRRLPALLMGALVAAVLTVATLTIGSTVATTAGAQSVETTSTLPTDNRQLGNSITRPNSGADPVDAGDPGGWLQVSLFYLICGGIVVIVGLAWWTSRRARQRRDAAGFDPVERARARGEGVRRAPVPSPAAADAAPERTDGASGASSDAPQHP